MKFPRIPVALLIVAGLAWSVAVPSTNGGTAKSAKAKSTPAKSKKGAKVSAKESARIADSLRLAGLKQRLDSLQRIDAAHRLDSLRISDSLHAVDSLIRIDSVKRVDSLQRRDSLMRVARTWYLGKPRDFTSNSDIAASLSEKLRLQLLRTGKVTMADLDVRDTNATFEGSWKAATASGAGRFLYSALYRTSDSGWKLSSWLHEIPTGRKIDSAVVVQPAATPKNLDAIASRTARLLRPSQAEARCDADSLSQASTIWAFEIPVNHTTDSTVNDRIRSGFAREFAKTGRAKSVPLNGSTYCPTRKCLDSLASSIGAGKVLQFDISRLADSSWRLGLVASATASDSLLDSILVTSSNIDGLVTKAVALLLPAPSSCRTTCTGTDDATSKLVWTTRRITAADSIRQAAALLLTKTIDMAFAADDKTQFLALNNPDAQGEVLATSAAGQGIHRMIEGRLDGSDSLWTLTAIVKNPRKDSLVDSIVLSRGGYRPRVFAWFARKLLEAAHPKPIGCGNPCSEESTSVINRTWSFPPTVDKIGEPTLAKLISDNLVGTMVSRKLGKVVSYPDTLPCQTIHCLDSIAAARGARNVLWTELSRAPDSSWMLSARVTESATDLVIDSSRQADTGNPIEALAHLPERILAALVPAAPRCDSCIPLDTLEAGLALIEPQWIDVIDTLQNIFLDSMSGVLAHDGHYQVIPWAATDSVYKRWKNKPCVSICRAALRCKTGASAMVTSSVARDGSGWRVSARLTDLRTGKTISEMSTREPRNDAQRLREIAPWAARKLVGTDSTKVAPSSRRFLDFPWGKLVALVIPVTAGLISVISRW